MPRTSGPPRFQHPRQIVKGGINVRAPDGLDERTGDVVVLVAGPVITNSSGVRGTLGVPEFHQHRSVGCAVAGKPRFAVVGDVGPVGDVGTVGFAFPSTTAETALLSPNATPAAASKAVSALLASPPESRTK